MKPTRLIQAVVLPVLILAAWEAWARIVGSASTKTLVLPPPTRIVQVLGVLLVDSEVWLAIARTLGTTVLGFALGSFAGIVAGLAIGSSPLLSRFVTPMLLGLRSLPVILYVPLALVLLNTGLSIPVALAAGITALYGIPPVAQAVAAYDHEKLLFLKARGRSTFAIVVGFLLPETVRAFSLTLSLAVTLSLSVTIVAEMLLPSLGGLGSAILRARELNNYPDLWALTALTALAGLLLHTVILGAWRIAAPWTIHDLAATQSPISVRLVP